jgi:uncharacterized protein (TIGR03118 family)
VPGRSRLQVHPKPLSEEITVKLHRIGKLLIAPALAAAALSLSASALQGQTAYLQTNLVSDVPGLAAQLDPHLVNPWGIAASATSPFWVSDNGAGLSTLYNATGVPQALVVSIPAPGPGVFGPTGTVFNSVATAFNGDNFLFASDGGTILGWRGALGTTAEVLENNSASGASYLGIALGTVGTTTEIYAANFAQNRIDVFSGVNTPASLSGSFTDSSLPIGYAPFNIQNIGGFLFVTYALVAADGDSTNGPGLGYVDKFDVNGNLLSRFASSGVLDAPWGMALAPSNFGTFSGDLLIGNFGDGRIDAFDFTTGAFLGTLKDASGNPIADPGLWGLRFGNGGTGGATNTLYFAAGINNEADGLYGSLSVIPVPEPSTYGVVASLALVGISAIARIRRQRGAKTAGV